MTDKHKIKIEVEVSDEFLADILITALEGGIGYWAYAHHYQHSAAPEYTRATLTPTEEDYDDWPSKIVTLNTGTILKGLERLLIGDVQVNREIMNWIRSGVASDDAGEIDSDAADVIVQAGIFGKIVYG